MKLGGCCKLRGFWVLLLGTECPGAFSVCSVTGLMASITSWAERTSVAPSRISRLQPERAHQRDALARQARRVPDPKLFWQ